MYTQLELELMQKLEQSQNDLAAAQRRHASTPSVSPFFELQIGGSRGNVPADIPLLHQLPDPDSGRTIVLVPVVINTKPQAGKPRQVRKFAHGRVARDPRTGSPIMETRIDQIVGRTYINASTIPINQGTVRGYAQLSISNMSVSDVTAQASFNDTFTGQGSSLDLSDFLNPVSTRDDTDEISTTGDFDPSNPLPGFTPAHPGSYHRP